MRMLHTSDWHLGRQFHNVSLLEDQRHVLEQIIAIVRERAVEVVLVAGDIYDRSVPPAEAVQLLDEVVHRLSAECGVPLILIAGNHDGAERLGFGARQLARAGVHISGPLGQQPEPVILQDAHGPVAFYPLPYAEPATVRSELGLEVQGHEQAMRALTARIRAHNGDSRRSVLIAHCFLDGFAACESERPLSIGGVETVPADCFAGFDYVALGHLHGPQARGAQHLRYSGSILKYSFSEENQRKSVTLVDMDAHGACTIEQVALRPRHDLRVLEGALEALLEQGRRDPAAADYLLVRLQDRHAILDPMGKLRTVYPNVLHLERPALAQAGERRAPDRERLREGELPMFRDFFRQMSGEALDDAGEAVVAALLERLHRGAEP
jgi:exonuclease SbcD